MELYEFIDTKNKYVTKIKGEFVSMEREEPNVDLPISTNVMVTSEFDDAVFLKAECACMGHEQSMTLEYDKKINDVTMTIYMDVDLRGYWGWKWYNFIFKRIMVALKVLFVGRMDLQGDFIFSDSKSIEQYLAALTQAYKKIVLVKEAKSQEGKEE